MFPSTSSRDFSIFSVENNSGFSVLLSIVVCIRFWPNFLRFCGFG